MVNTIKADLHMHGSIGFQDYWLKVQGYAGKNLLKLITDKCFEKDIGICAITSEEFEIPKNSVHDRLNWLKNKYEKNLPKEYETDSLGENILIVNKGSQKVYLVNGQTVIIKEDKKRFDYLVIGSNQVPNSRDFRETYEYCEKHDLIRIAEHPNAESHFGIGFNRLEIYLNDYHAIEGHNGQMIVPESLSFIPVIGKYNKGINRETIEFAKIHKKSYIATSDSHDVSGLGNSYIEFYEDLLNQSSGEKFISSLADIISENKFTTYEGYQNFLSWLSWTTKFQLGTR